MKVFPGIKIEGGLFSPDILEKIARADIEGQRPVDFGLKLNTNLLDEIASVFADARKYWSVFTEKRQKWEEDEIGTSETRDLWMIPFFRLLGYNLEYNRKAYIIDDLSFAISHRAGSEENAPPVHIVGAGQNLGQVAASGRPRLSPHALVQEYLNRSDNVWGIVTNGLTIRLLRDSTYIRRQSYLEFDLQTIMENQLFEDFAILYRLLHRSRLPKTSEDASQCILEKYRTYTIEQGGRVRENLRDGVTECLKILGNGFLNHPHNEDLRRRISSSENERFSKQDFYQQLLRLVYRFLFLLVSEERGRISSDPVYINYYSISRLRKLVDDYRAYNNYDDLWQSLRVLWKVFGDENLAKLLKASPLNGDLFKETFFDSCTISNRNLLEALWYLFYYRENNSSPPLKVNYSALDVEELGSVYESLLELEPFIDISNPQSPKFDFGSGTQRKLTGSYYTPAELVAELIHSALDPVIEERLKNLKTKEEKENAILSIKVCDPASGSGHFLLAAARRLGKELARIRTGEDEPDPKAIGDAIRDVISHCIYGVDKNPLAVELCRVALWIEAHCEGKPLTFLDHHIRCGDSLVGVLDLETLKAGIPDEAFEPAQNDNKLCARQQKHKNKKEKSGEPFLSFDAEKEIRQASEAIIPIISSSDDTTDQVRKKEENFKNWEQKTEPVRKACNLWTAAFFQQFKAPDSVYITTSALYEYLETGTTNRQILGISESIANENKFFHWPIEFPEVFAQGGFDVVLCNPPWERIKLQEQEFFSTRDSTIANAPNSFARKRLISELPRSNPALWQEYNKALHTADSLSRFLRGSNQCPLTARGDINTYSIFAERIRSIIRPQGRAGFIVPTGIATDANNQFFFSDLIEKGQLVSLFDFENRAALFPGVHRSYKFCLLTLSGKNNPSSTFSFSFFATRAEHLHNPHRIFTLKPSDIAVINPNTRTLPVFRTKQDAEITTAIYQQVPVLINENSGENPWGVRFMRMFDMSNDSHLFRTRAQLEAQGFRLKGNVFIKGNPDSPSAKRYLPLYEAKMIWHYDHRYGTYEGVSDRSNTQLPTPDEHQYANPNFIIQPWYWVPAEEVQSRLGDWKRGWLMGWRKITCPTNERSMIISIFLNLAFGDSVCLLFAQNQGKNISCLLANINTILFDYIVRQKLGGINLQFMIVRQLPVLPPSVYTTESLHFIVPRVMELVYTAWDIKPFADDVWREADDSLKNAIEHQWDENRASTGGHKWMLPDWIEAYPEINKDPQKGIPSPPFKWDEERRAHLKAELDAYYARLYGLTRKQLRYILDPADLTKKELENILDPWEEVLNPLDPEGYKKRVEQSDFPGETFRVLKEKEIREFGEYRTRRLILEAWKKLTGNE
jgi:hypothetical protein